VVSECPVRSATPITLRSVFEVAAAASATNVVAPAVKSEEEIQVK
jgi:hypothetical protein